jgi:precorrin-4/cobalt-precorrin-4 C11-methyltransferase
MTQVYIVAGGPGDPELITVKGRGIINNADIIFTGRRFFSDAMFAGAKEDCEILEYFDTTYEEKMEIIQNGVRQGKTVAVINMGDSCLFGMINGLADRLEKAAIDFEVVPGVSAFNASCAILKKQMTGMGLSNTAVCTTIRDRPDAEAYLDRIAALGASVALFMSVDSIDRICGVFKAHCPLDTPVAVISEASRPNQRIVVGDLQTISERLKEAEVKDGMILIGEFINKPFDYEVERQFHEMMRAKGWPRPENK